MFYVSLLLFMLSLYLGTLCAKHICILNPVNVSSSCIYSFPGFAPDSSHYTSTCIPYVVSTCSVYQFHCRVALQRAFYCIHYSISYISLGNAINQMISTVRGNNDAHLPNPKSKAGILKRLLHLSPTKESQITIRSVAGTIRPLSCIFRK